MLLFSSQGDGAPGNFTDRFRKFFARRGVRRGAIALGAVLPTLLFAIITYSIWESPPERPENLPPTQTGSPEDMPADDGSDFEGAISSGYTDGVFTFLLVGNDDGNGNTDTIMVGRFDTRNSTINIVSIPRDTMVNIGWSTKRINAVYWGTVNGGGVGIDGLKRQIKNICGFEVDCYAVIDINAFVGIIDAIDGVTFDVPIDMNYDDPAQNLSIHLSAGVQTLSGEQALGLVRFRQNNGGGGYGDIGRIETQQAFLKAAAGQMLSLGNIPNISAIIEILTQSTATDLSASNISFFVRQFLKCSGEDIRFYTAPTVGASIGGASYQSLLLSDWLLMVNDYLNPTGETVTEKNVNILTSNGSSFFSTTGEFAGGYGSFAGFSGGGSSEGDSAPSEDFSGADDFSDSEDLPSDFVPEENSLPDLGDVSGDSDLSFESPLPADAA